MRACESEQQAACAADRATRHRHCVAHAFVGAVVVLGLASAKPAVGSDWPSSLDGSEAGLPYRIDFTKHQIAQADEAGPLQDFDILAGDLQAALLQFSQAVDLQLLYSADLTAGLQTQGVQGSHTPEGALQLLIAGTGLDFRFTNDNTVTLERRVVEGGEAEEGGPAQLDPVTVTGARFATPVSELPAAITILDQQDLDQQPTFQRDPVAGLAKAVPGYSFTSPVGGQARLRGRAVSFRVNNIEINQRFRPTGNAIFDLPPDAFNRVEVVRGADATFGFGASGGAVNFRTPEPIPGDMQLTSTVGFMVQPTDVEDSISPRARQSVTGSLDSLDYWVEVGGSINQTLFDPDGDPLPDSDETFSNSDVIDFNTSLTWNLDEEQRLKTSHFFIRTFQDPEFIAVADGDPDTNRKTSTVPFSDFGDAFEDPHRRQYIGTASYENDDVLGSRLDFTVFYQNRVLRQTPGEVVPPIVLQVREENSRVGARVDVETPIGFLDDGWFAGTSVTWGADVQRFEYNAEEVSDPALPFLFLVPEAEETSRAGFAQLRVPFLDDFLFTGGVRYEDTEVDLSDANLAPAFGGPFEGGRVSFDQPLFNAGLVYFATDEIELYASFSQAADILDIARAPRLAAITSADEIRPEPSTTDQYEVGFRGTWDKVQATAAVFFSESDRASSFTIVPGTAFAAPVRRPQEIYGAEVTLDVQPWRPLGLGGTVSFSEGTTKLDDGQKVDLTADEIQPLKLTGYVEVSPFSWWRSRLQVSHQFSSDGTPELNEFGTDALTFVDLYTQLDVGPGTFQLGVENLLNTTEFNPTAQVNRNSVLGQIANVPYPGTTIFASYSIKW